MYTVMVLATAAAYDWLAADRCRRPIPRARALAPFDGPAPL